MQSTAVLLLEMAYEAKHVQDEEEDILTSIKKMIRWLRAMQAYDQVAARAYKVVWTILKSCSPTLQSKANELLAEDDQSPQPSPSDSSHQSSAGQQQSGPWSSGQFASARTQQPLDFDPQLLPSQEQDAFMRSAPAYYSSYSPEQYPVPMAFGNPFHTSFDQVPPVLSMQGLWMNPSAAADIHMDFASMSFQQQQMQNQAMQQMQYSMQQGGLSAHTDDVMDCSVYQQQPPPS